MRLLNGRPIIFPRVAPAATAIPMATARIKIAKPAINSGLPAALSDTPINPLYKESPGTSGTIAALIMATEGKCQKREVKVASRPTTVAAIALETTIPKPESIINCKIKYDKKPATPDIKNIKRGA